MSLDGNWGYLWLILAALLGLAELLVPGAFLVFLAAGAALTGVMALLFPDLGVIGQLLALGGWTTAAVLIGKRWYGDWPVASSDPLLNDRAARLVGQVVTVVDPLVQGQGRVRLGDGEWLATGPDLPVGARARIERVDGTLLVIAPLPGLPPLQPSEFPPLLIDRRTLLASTATMAATAALPGAALAQDNAEADARALMDRATDAILAENPEGATSLGVDKGARAGLKARLSDKTADGVRTIASAVDQRIASMKAINADRLSEGTRIDLEVTLAAHEIAAAGYRFPYGDVAFGGWRNSPYVVAQNVGAFLDVPQFLDDSHTVETAWDAEAYLARLDGYARQLDGETERLRDAAGRGVILSDFNLAKAINQLKIAQSGDPKDWTLVTSLARRTSALNADYGPRAERIVRARIAPALARQLAELERHVPQATGDAGVWKLPQGEEYYAWALSAATTTRLTPDEIHQMGQVQLAELQSQMDVILKSIGYSDGSVGARMTALGKDPRYLFPDNDAGRRQVIALLEKSIADMRKRMPDAFTVLAPGNVEVKRMAPEVEPGAPGAYGGAGTIDGKVPGRLWINLRTTEIWPRYALPDLAFHESIPGHAWQGEYTFKLPLIRSILGFNAYSEGWALYAEQLADELGYYADDPVMRLGYLQSLAFRACRLVVDTGLHAKRWTREQAIQWFATTNGSSVEEVRGEVDRYCTWPGQACGYKVGHSYINRLRDQAKAKLGARFDFRTFNDAVVTGGGVPMTVLDKVVERYIQRRSV